MTTYQIDPRNNAKPALTVEAESHQQAANKAARRYFGANAWANRETGAGTGSGVFQAYVTLSDGNQASSIGANFHVSEL